MDGFNKLPKMQCFKEGGSVNCKPVAKCSGGKMKEGGKADKAQDKSMVKKGVKQHESALHKGEPKTELKLKTGGRAKKAIGTVKKFEKASGEYGAKKTAADKKNIKEAKTFKPAFKKGGKVKKCNTGGSVDVKDPQALTDKIALEENTADANIIPNALKTVKRVGKKVIKSAKDMFGGQGAVSDAEQSNIAKKKGGKVKKYAAGGSVMSDEEKNWLGGADATDPFILARMRSALGDKKPAAVAAPVAAPVKQETSADLDPYGAARRETSADLDPYGAASKPVAAPVRRAPMRRPMAKPETSADLDPYGVTRRETSADLDPYGAANKPGAAPYIDIPANNPGMKQYRTDAVSPLGGMFNRFFNASPGDQAAQFRRGAEQRKKIGKNIGETIGMPKPSDN
jgi:hypothetical protein